MQVATSAIVIHGMYVNSTSSGTVKFFDGTGVSGTLVFNTITPAIGFHNLGDVKFTGGCYVQTGGTIDFTLFKKTTD